MDTMITAPTFTTHYTTFEAAEADYLTYEGIVAAERRRLVRLSDDDAIRESLANIALWRGWAGFASGEMGRLVFAR